MVWIKNHMLMIASIIVVAISLGFLGYILVDMMNQKATSTSSQKVEEEVQESANTSEAVSEEVIMNNNPFGSENSTLSEEDILNYMHGMSHQKVIADEKWLHYEMTNERILFLITVIENGQYEHEEVVLDILNRWKEGDFSQADKDHNAIWSIQGGTIGKATGVMSAEQEQQYIEDYQKSIK
ncbi:MAG TPA: DUF6241 domain-containing protein [Metabacillus sp.]|nr:DUF6241 domain-containing protein [Metabacillus sp.]